MSAPVVRQGAPLQLVWRWCVQWDRELNKGAGKPRPRPEDAE